MKLLPFDFPATSKWLELNGRRLDGRPYVSGAAEARILLEQLPAEKKLLKSLTHGGISGLLNIGRISRVWVNDSVHGIPFLSSTDILQADLSNMSLISKKVVRLNPSLILQDDWTLITRSGTIGRMAYCRPDMVGLACTEDVLRVVPNPKEILPGYLYAYLSSRFGVPLVVEGTYGAIIQHIEPHHIANLPVPRLGERIEEEVHQGIDKAAKLRSAYQQQIREATDLLFRSVGLRDITAAEWHAQDSDVGFARSLTSTASLRALNFNPRMEKLLEQLKSAPYMTLGEICEDGEINRSSRFTRVDSDAAFGAKLIGQRELFWFEPEGRWVSKHHLPNDVFIPEETILVAALGTLGESEVFCRSEFITGLWTQYAYAENILRLRSGKSEISGAFLFAFMRSETAFRCLRSLCAGSKQQVLYKSLTSQIPVPMPPEDVRIEIEQLIRDAYAKRHEASRLEKGAIAVVERVIQEGARNG